MKSLLAAFVLCVIGVGVAAAQVPVPQTLNGGVLNGKAVSLPKPEYPEGVRLAGIGGTVAVDIVIDENGQVISAVGDPLDQHRGLDANGEKLPATPIDPMLLQSAENAARMAKFSPTRLSGAPVQVKGRVIYNFVSTTEPVVLHAGNPDDAVMNTRAKSLPSPVYPAAARAVKAEGQVMVKVELDTEGNVISATAMSGHPLLRAAAQKAAEQAKFKSTDDDAQMPRSGVVIYNFLIGPPPQ